VSSSAIQPVNPVSPPPTIQPVNPVLPPPTTQPVTAFKNLSVSADFTWSSQQNNQNSAITITSGALGNVRVTVSNFIVIDPTGSGETIDATTTNMLVSTVGAKLTSPIKIAFGNAALLPSTQQVFVEVFSTDDGRRLGGGIVSVSSLLAGTATLAL
jgi:hypothetical protein